MRTITLMLMLAVASCGPWRGLGPVLLENSSPDFKLDPSTRPKRPMMISEAPVGYTFCTSYRVSVDGKIFFSGTSEADDELTRDPFGNCWGWAAVVTRHENNVYALRILDPPDYDRWTVAPVPFGAIVPWVERESGRRKQG